jgi:uncharacterized protein YneF (UPF0154 family)
MFRNLYFFILYITAALITFLIARIFDSIGIRKYRYDTEYRFIFPLIWPVALLSFLITAFFIVIDKCSCKLQKDPVCPEVKRQKSFKDLQWAIRFALNDGVPAEDILGAVKNIIVSDIMNS